MSYYRWSRILRALHFVNQEAADAAGHSDRKSKSYDSLYKVSDIMKLAYDSILLMRAPDQHLSIDEEVTPFCYLKCTKWGYSTVMAGV